MRGRLFVIALVATLGCGSTSEPAAPSPSTTSSPPAVTTAATPAPPPPASASPPASPTPAAPVPAACEGVNVLEPVIATSLVAVVGVLIDASPYADDTDVEIDRPADEAEARVMLCDPRPDQELPGCDPSAPFVTYYDPLGRIVANVVIPLEAGAGYAVYPDQSMDESIYDDRCPSDLVLSLEAATPARRMRVRSRRLAFQESGDCEDDDCAAECDVFERLDVVTIFARDGRHAIELELRVGTDDDARTPPHPPTYTEDAAAITATSCVPPERHPL
jgi:hypothetical protein